MKKIIGIILLVVLMFTGCDLGTGSETGNNNNNDNPIINETITIDKLSVKTTGIKSLYVSNISVSNGSRAVGDNSVIQTLSYINNVGQNTPFYFVSPSGKNIVLNVSDLRQLDDKRILVDFTSFYEITAEENIYTIDETISNSGRALVDMESGKVYEFKYSIQFVSNNIGYSLVGDGFFNNTLYKIDLNNISTAVPINNVKYNPIQTLEPPMVFSDKIIGWYNRETEFYSYDIHNSITPKPLQLANLTPETCSFVSGNTPITFFSEWSLSTYLKTTSTANGIIIQDLENNTWYFTFSQVVDSKNPYLLGRSSIGLSGNGNDYFISKLSINNDGEMLISDSLVGSNSFTINHNDTISMYSLNQSTGIICFIGDKECYNNDGMIIIFSNGFINLKKMTNKIQVESIASSMPQVNRYNSFIKENYLYYLEDSSIKRLYLGSGSSPETIYTNSRLYLGGNNDKAIISTGDNIIFYQFADDNISVNTYSLTINQQNIEPILLSTSRVEIQNIVELDF
jgi:hypothetical protein